MPVISIARFPRRISRISYIALGTFLRGLSLNRGLSDDPLGLSSGSLASAGRAAFNLEDRSWIIFFAT